MADKVVPEEHIGHYVVGTVKEHHITITTIADSAEENPDSLELCRGILEGLPKEWFDREIDGYSILSMEIKA